MNKSLSLEASLKLANELFIPFQKIFEAEPLKASCTVPFNSSRNKKKSTQQLPLNYLKYKKNIDPQQLEDSSKSTVKKVMINIDKYGVSRKIFRVCDDCGLDISYILFWDNRVFQIIVTHSPEIFGFYGTKFTDDPDNYLFAYISEIRDPKDFLYDKYDNVKYEMYFSLDIEKGTFLELFDLSYRNTKNIIRECTELNEMDEALKDKVILTIPKKE